jgi:ubiquinol-cytochrome c reductase cytochrome c1 subunit
LIAKMLRKAIAALAGLVLVGLVAAPAVAKTNEKEPMAVHWSFQGPLGKFDQVQLQRGYKVYAEVCSACHGMSLLSYRNLAQPGGPFFDPKHPNPNESPDAKAIAADIKVPDPSPTRRRPGPAMAAPIRPTCR